MNNFANYLTAQPQFNLYNFTHWSQIDVLNWFAGTADLTVQIPARPWVDTAHKNGVKVIGSVFLGIAQWGGNPDTVEALLEQDPQGRFILADKLIQIADYYGFDGWLMNQETDLTAVKDAQNQLVKGKKDPERGRDLARRLLAFMQYLTANAPQGMEIHWYDSMLASGEVRWQNQLNAKNQQFLQAHVPSADAITGGTKPWCARPGKKHWNWAAALTMFTLALTSGQAVMRSELLAPTNGWTGYLTVTKH
jgi:endo-beta-N-acetylglucosaminidase D